jgi:hypothetical protein
MMPIVNIIDRYDYNTIVKARVQRVNAEGLSDVEIILIQIWTSLRFEKGSHRFSPCNLSDNCCSALGSIFWELVLQRC